MAVRENVHVSPTRLKNIINTFKLHHIVGLASYHTDVFMSHSYQQFVCIVCLIQNRFLFSLLFFSSPESFLILKQTQPAHLLFVTIYVLLVTIYDMNVLISLASRGGQ